MSDRKNAGEELPMESSEADAVQVAIEYGIDIRTLIDNLKRTPAERIRRHQIALNTAKRLREARYT